MGCIQVNWLRSLCSEIIINFLSRHNYLLDFFSNEISFAAKLLAFLFSGCSSCQAGISLLLGVYLSSKISWIMRLLVAQKLGPQTFILGLSHDKHLFDPLNCISIQLLLLLTFLITAALKSLSCGVLSWRSGLGTIFERRTKRFRCKLLLIDFHCMPVQFSF